VTQDGDPYHFNYDGVNTTWGPRRYAYQLKHIGDIYASVFGSNNVGQGLLRKAYRFQ
jgi:hypothetical protein